MPHRPEAADGQRRPVGYVRDRLRGRRHHLVHDRRASNFQLMLINWGENTITHAVRPERRRRLAGARWRAIDS